MAHSFGNNSKKQYETLHNDLQLILDHVILLCEIDFSITEGYRPPEKQFEYYKSGRKQDTNGNWIVVNKKNVITNVDGYIKKGKHNIYPSVAVDIAACVAGKPQLTYDISHLSYIAGYMMSIARKLYDEGKIKHLLRWGGNWDGDSDLADNLLNDKPHFELYNI